MPPHLNPPQSVNEFFLRKVNRLARDVSNLNARVLTLLPSFEHQADVATVPGVEPTFRQVAIKDDNTAWLYGNDHQWHPMGGGGCDCLQVIYVGTPTQTAGQVDIYGNNVPDLIAANPPPYNASPWVPFLNSWNNSLAAGGAAANDGPVAFFSFCCMTVIQGGASGGADNSVVFNLPLAFRPRYQQEFRAPRGAASGVTSGIIGANGDVKYLQVA